MSSLSSLGATMGPGHTLPGAKGPSLMSPSNPPMYTVPSATSWCRDLGTCSP